MKPVNIAIMSCTHGHARGYYSLRNNPKYRLVAVSIVPDYKERVFIERLEGIPQYYSDEEMFNAHPEIEAVIMASENYRHLEQVKMCAEKGIHILSMKIPTFIMEEYDEMISLIEKAGIVCQVELELRHNCEILRIKDLLENCQIGKILSFTASNTSHNPMWWSPWHGIPEQIYGKRVEIKDGSKIFRGGALSDHPHIFDIIRYITDSDYESVYAELAPNIRKDIEIEDMITIIGKMKNGIIFSLDPSYACAEKRVEKFVPGTELYPKRVEVNMTIHGEKGSIIADVYGQNVYHNGLPDQRYTIHRATGHLGGVSPRLEEFYRCIRFNEKPTIDIKQHRRTIEFMNACYESIRLGKIIKLN